MSQREVVVLSGVRTAIGGYGGSLKDIPPTKLGASCVKDVVGRAGVDPARIGHVVFGSVIHGEARDMYLSRVAAIDAGLAVGTPCLTVLADSTTTARSAADAPEIDGVVKVKGGRLRVGEFVDVVIERSDEHDLYGRRA